jgi:hypothetical protein
MFLRAALLALVAFASAASGNGANLYVDSKGNDLGDGSSAHPFASLERARGAIRSLKQSGQLPIGGVTVWLRGTFRRTSSFVLAADDGGTSDAPIVYRALPGEWVSITGGRDLPKFTPVTDQSALAHFDSAVRPFIRAAKVSVTDEEMSALGPNYTSDLALPGPELYYDDAPMTVASWPNHDWSRIVSLPTGKFSGRFEYEGDRPRRWTHLGDIVLHGFWAYDWFDSFETVREIDPDAHQIQTNYVAPANAYGFVAGQRYRAVNVMEELDEPGEWYLDRLAGVLYFWPPDGNGSGRAVLSLTDTPLVVMNGTSYVTWQGIVFEASRSSGISITGGDHNRVAACILRNLGTVAVAIGAQLPDLRYVVGTSNPAYSDTPGTENGVISSLIYNTAKGGVLLGGGDRKTLTPGHNYVINTEIHDFSIGQRTGAAAVFLYGAGNLVEHNKIYNAPQTAVFIWGNDHTIAYNDISRVCLEIDDAGAINYGRDYSQRGSVIRDNYIHDIPGIDGGHIGVYLDDFASGTTVVRNVFARVSLAVNIGGGRENVIDNNVFVDCTRAINLDARGLTWAHSYFTGADTTLADRLALVAYDRPPYSDAYPRLPSVLTDGKGLPKYNVFTRNVIVGGKGITYADGAEIYPEVHDNYAGDPGFISSSTGDYRLRGDSAAWATGFEQIRTSEMGLYSDDLRSQIPKVPVRRRAVSAGSR